jgi:tetratricopeptide (TPR) repeat protein
MMDRGQYPAAEQLLIAMLDKTEPFQQRDVLYSLGLIAEQRGDLGMSAARYLEAATLQSSDALDAQAQLARLQAASVLARAGLHRDARRQYEMVLSVTQDEGQRELIQRALARL